MEVILIAYNGGILGSKEAGYVQCKSLLPAGRQVAQALRALADKQVRRGGEVGPMGP